MLLPPVIIPPPFNAGQGSSCLQPKIKIQPLPTASLSCEPLWTWKAVMTINNRSICWHLSCSASTAGKSGLNHGWKGAPVSSTDGHTLIFDSAVLWLKHWELLTNVLYQSVLTLQHWRQSRHGKKVQGVKQGAVLTLPKACWHCSDHWLSEF